MKAHGVKGPGRKGEGMSVSADANDRLAAGSTPFNVQREHAPGGADGHFFGYRAVPRPDFENTAAEGELRHPVDGAPNGARPLELEFGWKRGGSAPAAPPAP